MQHPASLLMGRRRRHCAQTHRQRTSLATAATGSSAQDPWHGGIAITYRADAGFTVVTLQHRRQLEADAPFDDEVAQLLKGANRDPEIIRQRVIDSTRYITYSAKLLMTSTELQLPTR